MNQTVLQAAALILPLIFAIVFHEVAHGLAARALGDPTAEQLNRLSLNPLRHVDPLGTVILPGLLALTHLPIFGWAKPVPVNARRLRNPRRDMALVGAAGPAMNLVMAVVAALALGLIMRGYAGGGQPSAPELFVIQNLTNFIEINVFLALFNLLPVPPFDGSHIVEGVLPDAMAAGYAKIRALGMLLPIVLLIVLPSLIPGFSVINYIAVPVDWMLEKYARLASLVAGAG